MRGGRKVMLSNQNTAATSPGGAALEVICGNRHMRWEAVDVIRIGRAADSDVALEDDRVSRRHADVVLDGRGTWSLVDHSRLGTYVDGRRVDRVTLNGPLCVRLAAGDGPLLQITPSTASPPATVAPRASAGARSRLPTRHRSSYSHITIGRASDNHVVVADLLASRHHAEVRVTGPDAEVVDLNSHNGTYLNGARVHGSAPLKAGDDITVAGVPFRWDGLALHRAGREPSAALVARQLTVRTQGGGLLLDGVSFTLAPRSLLAVLGPSGAGKSTLLGALTGLRPASSGDVHWHGRDLYVSYEELRTRIGLVPQDDILHPQLTVRRALTYAAELRFPADTTAAERESRIAEVLSEVGLSDRADLRIDRLSGGQRKRTSIALELLTAPGLLFLDEPTSGLDPGLDRQVMSTLRGLADADRTVVVVTHSVLNLGDCDRLLLLARGGRVAFFGPPSQLLRFFDAPDHSSVFLKVEADPDTWVDRYASSATGDRFTPGSPNPGNPETPPPAPPVATSGFGQWRTLVRRHVAVLSADREFVFLLLGLPLLLGLLQHIVPGHLGLSQPSVESSKRLTVYILGGTLIGAAMAIRELVSERPIYARERAVGLSPNAYLGSKLSVIGCVVAAQAAVFCAIGMLGLPGPAKALVLPNGDAELVVAVVAAAVSMMVLGLVLSALVRTVDQTMPLLVGTVMAQLMLSGALVPVAGRVGLEQLSVLTGARWAFLAAASTTTPAVRAGAVDAWANHSSGRWLSVLLALGVLTVVLVICLRVALDRSVRRRPIS